MRWLNSSIEHKIIVAVTLAFVLLGTVSALFLIRFEQLHVEEMLLNESRIIFQQLELTRSWNARHGGVYTFMKPADRSNPYLYEVGPGDGKSADIEPEIRADDGRRLMMKNPAMMTRETSDLAEGEPYARFHLTSLKLLNPANAPDQFEKASLEGFSQKGDESYRYEKIDGKMRFRYMAPLMVKASCLNCHGVMGYKVGELRGGISVSIPVEAPLLAEHKQTMAIMMSLMVIYVAVILLLIWGLRQFVTGPVRRLVLFSQNLGDHKLDHPTLTKNPDEVGQLAKTMINANQRIVEQQGQLMHLNRKLEEQTRRDPLTSLHNRRHLMLESGQWFARAKRARSPISTLMIDIDHFKDVNDQHGHKVGDQMLQHVSDILKSVVREYDMLIRFGGEEFLILLPDTGNREALVLAERIRKAFEVNPFHSRKMNFSMTVSIGVYTDGHYNLETSIAESDKALYRAKKEGRNRVVSQN